MRFVRHLAAAAALLMITTGAAQAQEQRGEAKASVAGKAVAVEYGRPVLAGRDMLGQAKPGVAWRMGSGSPTSLKTEADLAFGAVAVPKGSYILTAVKDDKGSWTMIVSKPEGQVKVAEVPLASTALEKPVEQFTIELAGQGAKGTFSMSWGSARMSAAFTGK